MFATGEFLFIVSVTSQDLMCSGGLSQIERHGCLQLARASHVRDGGAADQWCSMPSDDRIPLDLTPGGEPSTESADVGRPNLGSTRQSSQDDH